jgi:Domain of unknown function (DUF4384)
LESEVADLPRLAVAAPAVMRPLWARPKWQAASAMVALATAAAVFLVPRRSVQGLQDHARFKGGDSLGLFVRGAGQEAQRVVPGDVLGPGDAIRFELTTRAASHVVVVGLDAKGQVTPYYPTAGNAKPIVAGKGMLLPGSIVLDDTLGAERIFAVLCDGPIAVSRVVEAAEAAVKANPGHPEEVEKLELDCRQPSFLIEKAK